MKPARKQTAVRTQGSQRPAIPQQVRIIGGQWKRTPLPVLNLPGLRPTPDRVRETVFNWLHHLRGGNWNGLSCLDLFAGSGALGFEAASRGAASVTMVELNRDAVSRLEATRAKLNASQVSILKADAASAIHQLQLRQVRFDVIFLDPPYGYGWISTILPLCAPLLAPGGVVYAESDQELPALQNDQAKMAATPAWLEQWETVRADKAGVVAFQLLKRKSMADFQA